MGRKLKSRSALSHLASTLMLMALIVRAALPQGWMPESSSASLYGASFVICSVGGPLKLSLNQKGQPVPDSPDDGAAHQPCAFASLSSLCTSADCQPAPEPQLYEYMSRSLARHLVPDTATFGPSRARAPPASRALS